MKMSLGDSFYSLVIEVNWSRNMWLSETISPVDHAALDLLPFAQSKQLMISSLEGMGNKLDFAGRSSGGIHKVTNIQGMGSEGLKTKKIFVGGIPRTVNEDEFRGFFSQFGEVKEHLVIRDHLTGGSRGFGFVTFHTEQAVDDLLGMGNRIDFAGVQVEVKKAEPRKPKVAPPPSENYGRKSYDGFGGALSGYVAGDVGCSGAAYSGGSNAVPNGCYGTAYAYRGGGNCSTLSIHVYYRGACSYSIKGYDQENSNSMIDHKEKGKGKTWSIMWSTQLPEEIMHLILQRLCVRDYLQFPKVCSSWRQAVRTATASKCYPPSEIPWFAYSLNRFFCPSQWKIHNTIDRHYKEYVGSIDGWLIEVRHKKETLQFKNPISRCKVKLPSPDHNLVFHKIAASSIPTNPHCVVASLSHPLGKLSFCRPTDESWTLIDQDEYKFGAIEIIDWKLYAATNEKLMVFDLSIIQDDNGQLPSYRIERTLVMLHPEPYRSRIHEITDGKVAYYLAKDSKSKELFVMFVENTFAYDSDRITTFVVPPRTQDFHLFKLELNNSTPPRWVEVLDLGARILFLSKTSNVFISTDEYSYLRYGLYLEAKLERNSIVFASNDVCFSPSTSDQNLRHIDVFSLANRSIKTIGIPEVELPFKFRVRVRPVWITPSPW